MINLSILCALIISTATWAVEPSYKSRPITGSSLPKDGDTCFAPDEPCDTKLIDFVKASKKSIDIAIYDINLDQLVHQLLIQSKRIKVRVVVDKRQSKGPHSLVSTLIKGGVEVRYGHQRGIMHDKFTVIDGIEIETGSFNYTNHAAKSNQENQVYLTNPQTVGCYKERFEKMWGNAKQINDGSKRGLANEK